MNYSKFLIALGFIALVAACGKNENKDNSGSLSCNGGYTLQNMNNTQMCCPAQGGGSGYYGQQGMGCVMPTQTCQNGGLYSQTYNQCLIQDGCQSGSLKYNGTCITYQQAGASVTAGYGGYYGQGQGGYYSGGYYGTGYTNGIYPMNTSYGYGMQGMGMYGGLGFGMNPYMYSNPYMNPYMYGGGNYNGGYNVPGRPY